MFLFRYCYNLNRTDRETANKLRIAMQRGFGENTQKYSFEPPYDKTNKMACAPRQDSDPPSWIRVFAVRMKKAWVISYPLSAQRRFRSNWVDAQADRSLGAQSFCWFCHESAHFRTTKTQMAKI